MDEVLRELGRKLPGVYWSWSANRPGGIGPFNPGEGGQLVKLFGPDLVKLEQLAEQVRERLRKLPGVEDVGVSRLMGQSDLRFAIDREKCLRWGVQVGDVRDLVALALHGKVVTQLTWGEEVYDVTLCWSRTRRNDPASILDIPVDAGSGRGPPGELGSPGKAGKKALLAPFGPRVRLRDLVSPVGADGKPDPGGPFVRPGASVIYREQGQRVLPLRFRVRGRDAAAVVAEARAATAPLFRAPYRAEWGAR
jgi:cobalt-zinc-cadmium resistance protein CzcA